MQKTEIKVYKHPKDIDYDPIIIMKFS